MAPDDITPESDSGTGGPSETYEYVEEVVEYKNTRGLRTLLIVLLVLLLLLLVGVGYLLYKNSQKLGGPGSANKGGNGQMVWVRSIYGWGTGENQQLVSPNAVAVAPDGTIWANSRNHMAVAFTPHGDYVRLFMSNSSLTAEGATATPKPHPGSSNATQGPGVQAIYAIDVDAGNNVFIADDDLGNVLKMTPDGHVMRGWAVPGLGKASANNSFVAVTGKGNLGVFNQSTGQPVYFFGTRGSGKNQFDLPAGVHIDDQGYVYVADTQNQRVRKYDPSGRLLWDAGTPPVRQYQSHVQAPTGLFQFPTGVTTDGRGRVVVVDAFNYNITVLDPANGKKIASYGEYGQADGEFDSASAIAYDRTRDYFVIADTGNDRLQIVRIPGSSGALTPATLFARTFANPLWVFCLPPLILLLAALVTYLLNRRRKKEDAEGEPPTGNGAGETAGETA